MIRSMITIRSTEKEERMGVDDVEEDLDINCDDDSDEDTDCDATNDKDDESKSNDAGTQNPEYLEFLSLWGNEKYDNARFIARGGKTLTYDFNNQDEQKALQKMISAPPPGLKWTTIYQRVVKPRKSKLARKGSNGRKAFAKGFTMRSVDEEMPATK